MKKSMFILAVLMLAASYSFADDVLVGYRAKRDSTLQQNAYSPDKDYAFQVGDTIVISRSVEHYLTGEEPSKWVYYVRHTIQQIGGKRFPQGILVGGIISWIGPDDALLVGTTTTTTAAETRKKKDAAAVKKQKDEFEQLTPVEQQEVVHNADSVGAQPISQVPSEGSKVSSDQAEESEQAVVITPIVGGEQTVEQQNAEETQTEEQQAAEEEKVVEEQPTEQQDTVQYGQVDRFTIGLRGGMATLLQSTVHNTKSAIGGDVLLDLQYAHYWQSKQDHLLGLLVGVSAGFAQGGLTNKIYTVTADNVKEDDRDIQVEIPIMFSYIFNSRFFLNVGPRLMLPVYTPYSQTFKNPSIDAYFEDWGVHVTDEVATGKLTQTNYKGQSANKMNLNILLGLELGYEWTLKNKNSLGLGVYANYDLFNTFKQNTQDNKSLLDVNPAVPTTIDINAASDIYTKSTGYLDAGLKIVYHFNWWRK